MVGALFIFTGCDKKSTSSTEKKEEVKKTLVYDKSDIKVELDSKGEAFLTYKEVDAKDKSVATNVSSTAVVQAGQSDVCEGHTRLMFISKEGTLSYLDIDALVCGKKITVKDVDGYKNIVAVYNEDFKTNDYEPILHKVFTRDKDGTVKEITNDLVD